MAHETTTCTLIVTGTLTTQEAWNTMQRAILQQGSDNQSLYTPHPGRILNNETVFSDRFDGGSIDYHDLAQRLLALGLSFAWIIESHGDDDRTITVGTPEDGIFEEPVTCHNDPFVARHDLGDAQRIATVQRHGAIIDRVLQGHLVYAPSAHAQLAAHRAQP